MDRQKMNYAEFMEKDILVNIPDMVKELLRKIWIILIVAVLAAAGAAGVRYKSDLKTASLESSQKTQTIASLEESLSDSEISDVKAVLALTASLNQQKEYLSDSIYMQIDGVHEDRVSMQYYIEANDASADIADMYIRFINNGGLTAALRQKGVDIESQYLKELVTATSKTEEKNASADMVVDTVPYRSSLSVFVVHQDEKQCIELADSVTECIRDFHDSLLTTVGEHNLSLLDQYYSQVVDEEVWNKGLFYSNNILTETTRLDTLRASLNGSQMNLLQAYLSDGEDKAEVSPAKNVPVRINRKVAAFGAAAGFVIACIILALWYVLRGTINCKKELQGMYNLCVLGEMDGSSGNKHVRRGKKNSDSPEVLLAKCINICRTDGISRVMTVSSDTSAPWMKAFKEGMEEAGIQMEIVPELDSAGSIQKMSQYKQIILTKRLKKDHYRDLEKEVQLCMEQQADILGVVLL